MGEVAGARVDGGDVRDRRPQRLDEIEIRRVRRGEHRPTESASEPGDAVCAASLRPWWRTRAVDQDDDLRTGEVEVLVLPIGPGRLGGAVER